MYVFPFLGQYEFIFFRLFGPGIGNSLLIWARALIYSHRYNLKMLQPTWNNFSIGPVIRKQKDFRIYADLFKQDSSYLNNLRKLKLLIFNKKVFEENIIEHNFKSDDVLIVKGLKNFFNDLYGANDLIYENILKITMEKNLQGINFNYENSITLHVRRSDFIGFSADTESTDDQWFVRIVNLLRKKLKKELKVYIFSDVKNDQIQNLLSLKNVCRLDYKTSIADLLSMTKSKIFVGSKHSTFSHWVSYLGQMPTVWSNGCHINKAHGKLLRANVIETDGFVLDENFIFECEKSLNSKKNLF
jgi:hypothetical protein